MTLPWTAERVVEPALARALIEQQFPHLSPALVESLGAGFDNTAYRVNQAWVFRFPRRAIAVPLLEREALLLPALASALPLAIPVPEWLGAPSDEFPWPFAGYRLLPGRTACGAHLDDAARARAAPRLAGFLAALHAEAPRGRALGLPGDELGRLEVPRRQARAGAALDELAPSGLVAPELRRALDAILEAMPADAAPGPAILAHGDLYARHLVVDEAGALTGVIDWGDVHLGGRAVDLAAGFELFPPAVRERFLAAYGAVDDATWRLARFRAVAHAATVLRYGHAIGDADLVREASRSLTWTAAG